MTTWTEAAGYAAVDDRAAGRCEVTGLPGTLIHHHRIRRSHGPLHAPWNLIGLRPEVHDWIHGHPDAARLGGWMLHSGEDPEQIPVWLSLTHGWPGWWILAPAADGPHLAVPVDPAEFGLLPVPLMFPPGSTDASGLRFP